MKVERLKKDELDKYCKKLGIETKGFRKAELISAVYLHRRTEIDAAIISGDGVKLLKKK